MEVNLRGKEYNKAARKLRKHRGKVEERRVLLVRDDMCAELPGHYRYFKVPCPISQEPLSEVSYMYLFMRPNITEHPT